MPKFTIPKSGVIAFFSATAQQKKDIDLKFCTHVVGIQFCALYIYIYAVSFILYIFKI